MTTKNWLNKIFATLIMLIIGLGILFFILKIFPDQQEIKFSSLSFGIERQTELQQLYSSDEPIFIQFLFWIKKALTLKFGYSTSTGKPVISILKNSIKPTLMLSLLSILWAMIISYLFATISAIKKNTTVDGILSSFMMVVYSIPVYWIGMLLLYFFSIKFHLFPSSQLHSLSSGNENNWVLFKSYFHHLFLPSIALGAGYAAYFYKFLRIKIIDILDSDFLMAAIARGLNKKMIFITHILPNLLIISLSLLSTITPAIIGGTVTIEYIFSIPGLGKNMVNAAVARDIPLIMGGATVSFFFVMLMNIVLEAIIVLINPQTRSQVNEKK